MCRFKTWHSDEHGYVIQCEECFHFQVSFGTTMLTMDHVQYHHFTETICKRVEDRLPMPDPNCKCIILPTHTEAIHIILSDNELSRLHDMIQLADTEMRTKALMDLF